MTQPIDPPITLEELMPHVEQGGILFVELAATRALLARSEAQNSELRQAVAEAVGGQAEGPPDL